MKIPRAKLAAKVADATLSSGLSKDYSRQIAAYLLAEDAVGELDSLLRDVRSNWANKGFVEVLTRSAFPLSDGIKATITERVKTLYPTAKQIKITEVIDSHVIGGVQIGLAGQQLDLSISAKLNKFKQLTGDR